MRPQQKIGAAPINLTLSETARKFLQKAAELRRVSRTQIVEDLIQAAQNESDARKKEAKKAIVNGINEVRCARKKK